MIAAVLKTSRTNMYHTVNRHHFLTNMKKETKQNTLPPKKKKNKKKKHPPPHKTTTKKPSQTCTLKCHPAKHKTYPVVVRDKCMCGQSPHPENRCLINTFINTLGNKRCQRGIAPVVQMMATTNRSRTIVERKQAGVIYIIRGGWGWVGVGVAVG